MRINELAKKLSEQFSISVKAGDLTGEIRDLPEFSDIRDTIKSHASSVAEDVVDRIVEIYEERHAAPGKKEADAEATRKALEEAQRLEEIRLRKQQREQQKVRDLEAKQSEVEKARQQREEEIRRRDAMKSRGIPGTLPVPKSLTSSGAAIKPRVAPVPLPGRRVPTQPAPALAPAATSTPVAEAAAPAATAKAPAGPAGTVVQAKASPSAAPSTTAGKPTARSDGQPPPPPMPSLRPDSPFRMRPAKPAHPGSVPAKGEPSRTPRGPAQGRGAGESERPPRRPDRERRPPAAGESPAPLIIPELEVMTLKTPGRRAKEKTKTPAVKKKSLKTIVREEIEVRPSKVYGLADEFRRPIIKKSKGDAGKQDGTGARASSASSHPTGPVRIGSTITVGEFAEKINLPASDIIKQVFLMGKPLTINHLIEPDLCDLIAQEHGITLEIQTEGDEQDIEQYRPKEDDAKKVFRPPVVTIMGHVDHGKTTLLDAYRSSTVALGEFGGITQHIGAYRVQTPKGEVIFLDTPGHEAFTSMRARGAKVTDVVVLVVSADDGVMPQTVEAINHAREANVPIIVAINKMDLGGANPDRIRTQLMQHSILPESLGGSNIFVEISAKKKIKLDELLDMILLQAGVLELKADPSCAAEGVIIESHVDPLRGAVATVLVRKGTLRTGDGFVVGTQSGRVRLMIDDCGQHVEEATPSHPVEITGLSGTPEVGELFVVMAEERLAREIASRRADRRRRHSLESARHVTLEGLHELVAEGKLKDLKIILKADVQGSLEAISQSLLKLSNDEVKVRLLHKSTGGITESDINLADASDAIVIGFNVRPDPAAAALAQREGIEVKTYRIIYELIEEIQKAILGMLEKQYKETILGRAQIRQIFKGSRTGNIGGCMVLDGEISRSARARLVRDSVVVYEGKLGSLRRVKDDVSKVAAGFECGLTLENYQDIKEGDIVEVFQMEEIPIELAAAT